MSTFLNRVQPDHSHDEILPPRSRALPSYDALLEIDEPAPGVYEVENHAVIGNRQSGTMLGGAQALLAELLAERAVEREDGGRQEAFDLDIRYLDPLRTPMIRARAEVLPSPFDHRCVRVTMVEADHEERLVSLATLFCRPVT
jgi:acyl-coenzyme A thioesterase PaaI-like protein